MSIDKNKIFVSSGDENSPLRAFYNNEYVFINNGNVTPFSYQIPTYTTNGGTVNYYSQDAESIFTNLSAPFIRFKFCGGTESLSGDSYIEHKIYRVEYDIFKSYEDPTIAAELMSDGFAKEGWKVTCETKDLNQEI